MENENKYKKSRIGRPEEMATISAYVPKSLVKFIRDNEINFSFFVRDKLDTLIKEHVEKMKQFNKE
jgi:hypothetical protein